MDSSALEGIYRLIIMVAFIYATFILIFFVVGFINRKRRKEVQLRLLNRQAEKRNGSVIAGSAKLFPRLSFQQHDKNIEVYGQPKKRYRRVKTFFECNVRNQKVSGFLIYNKSALSHVAQAFGMQDIQTGHKTFDDAFVTQCKIPEYVKGFLDDDLRKRLLSMRLRNICVRFERKQLLISVDQLIEKEEDYDLFIDLGLSFVEKMWVDY